MATATQRVQDEVWQRVFPKRDFGGDAIDLSNPIKGLLYEFLSEYPSQYKQELKAALDAEGIAYTNRFYVLGYNAPYEFFNRKNEVIVELESEDL